MLKINLLHFFFIHSPDVCVLVDITKRFMANFSLKIMYRFTYFHVKGFYTYVNGVIFLRKEFVRLARFAVNFENKILYYYFLQRKISSLFKTFNFLHFYVIFFFTIHCMVTEFYKVRNLKKYADTKFFSY